MSRNLCLVSVVPFAQAPHFHSPWKIITFSCMQSLCFLIQTRFRWKQHVTRLHKKADINLLTQNQNLPYDKVLYSTFVQSFGELTFC